MILKSHLPSENFGSQLDDLDPLRRRTDILHRVSAFGCETIHTFATHPALLLFQLIILFS